MTSETQKTPDWFWRAIETEPEKNAIEVREAKINFSSWSRQGPGLLFVHGHNAHAGWWDFIAPFFKDQYRVVANDLSGMGDSDHRDSYDCDTYIEELIRVVEFNELGKDTIIVAHSFGGIIAVKAFAAFPDRFKGLVLLDSGVKHPDDQKSFEPPRSGRQKIYPNAEIAASRFRLQPPQQCENQYILDHIARNSVEYVDGGFTWKFDDEHLERMKSIDNLEEDFRGIKTKCSLIYGEKSQSFSEKSAGHMKDLLPHLEVIKLEGAQHHLFLDQPISFVEKLKDQLSAWR
ncbi:MAG: alpha/beta hydrolase [Gammaproteobacteria bacterium]|nr:alpha/beta hydrolase [Gammaproteobacteria bacterium]